MTYTVLHLWSQDVRLGDVINFGKGPARVTGIMDSLFNRYLVTTKGTFPCAMLTQLLVARPDGLAMPAVPVRQEASSMPRLEYRQTYRARRNFFEFDR